MDGGKMKKNVRMIVADESTELRPKKKAGTKKVADQEAISHIRAFVKEAHVEGEGGCVVIPMNGTPAQPKMPATLSNNGRRRYP